MRLNPFRAVRPPPDLAPQVASVPYDVVNRGEAAELARGNPHSFLHVGRSDIDLPEDAGSVRRADLRGAPARHWTSCWREARCSATRSRGSSSIARSWTAGRRPAWWAACTSTTTSTTSSASTRRPGRTRRTTAPATSSRSNANAEPVFLTYRGRAGDRPRWSRRSRRRRRSTTSPRPTASGTRSGGCPTRGRWRRTFDPVPLAYVADGHHRSASAWRAGKELQGGQPLASGRRGVQLVPGGALSGRPAPDPALQPRGARPQRPDAGGESWSGWRGLGQALAGDGPVRRERSGVFCVYLDGRWHRLELDPAEDRPRPTPSASLDVSLLQDRVLSPDPRHRRPADRQADRFRGRDPRHGGAGAAGALGRDGHRVLAVSRPRWTSSWRCPTRVTSCRPRAPGSSPSCGAGCSCMS